MVAAGFPKHEYLPERPPLPVHGVLLSAGGSSPADYGLSLDDARRLICQHLANERKASFEQVMSMLEVAEMNVSTHSAWEMERLQLYRMTVDGGDVLPGTAGARRPLSGMGQGWTAPTG